MRHCHKTLAIYTRHWLYNSMASDNGKGRAVREKIGGGRWGGEGVERGVGRGKGVGGGEGGRTVGKRGVWERGG